MAKKQTDALSFQHMNDFTIYIEKMHAKHRLHEQSPFTHDDALHLLVEAEDHAAVMAAARLYTPGQLPSAVWLSPYCEPVSLYVETQIKLGGGRDWGFPNYSGGTYQNIVPPSCRAGAETCFAKSAPPELVDRFNEYIDQKARTALEYGLVHKTLQVLNELCTAPSQMAFLWPTIKVMAKALSPKHEALFDKKPKTVPGVSPGLRLACQTTATTVMMNQLMSEPPTSNEKVFVTFHNPRLVVAEGPLGAYTAI